MRPRATSTGRDRAVVLDATDQIFDADAYKNLVVAYKNGAPIRIGDIGTVSRRGGGRQGSRLAAGQAHGHHRHPQAARVQRRRDDPAHQGPAAGADRRRCRRASKLTVVGDRTQTIEASVHDVQVTLVITVGLVVLVIFVFLRNLWATRDSRRRDSAVARSPLSASCTCWATASTICR